MTPEQFKKLDEQRQNCRYCHNNSYGHTTALYNYLIDDDGKITITPNTTINVVDGSDKTSYKLVVEYDKRK